MKPRREHKFTLDTNLYVRAFRDQAAQFDLERFHVAFAPFEYLTSVVAHELRAGTSREYDSRLERTVFAPFERRRRVLAPGYGSWKEAGAVIARLRERRLLDWKSASRGFVHDVLLAVTCREWGITLVTDNVRDFERIAAVFAFSFAPPWPTPSS